MSRQRPPSISARLVEQIAALTGPGTELLQVKEREWASATFAGTRYAIDLAVPVGTRGNPMLLAAVAALPEHEFTLIGVIVADCTAKMGGLVPGPQRKRLLQVEVLTVAAD